MPSSLPSLFDPVRRRRRRVSPFSLSSLLRGRGSPAQKDRRTLRKAKEEHRQSVALRVQCLCSPLLAASTSSADSRSCCLPPPPFARAPRAGERSLGKSCCSSKEKKREKGKKKRTKRRPNGEGQVIFRTTSDDTDLISTKQEGLEVDRKIPQPGERRPGRLPSGFNRPGSSQRRGDVKSGPTPRPRQPGESGPGWGRPRGTRRATTGFSLRRAGRLTPGE